MMPLGYIKIGSGPIRVIGLHGWLGDHSTFHPLFGALDLSAFTFVFPAYRGYGLSRHLTGSYTLAEISADISALADQLHWDRFDLVGHSMGAKLAQRILVDAPTRVRKIVAVTPAPAGHSGLTGEALALFEGAGYSLDNRRKIADHSTGFRLSSAYIERVARYSMETSNVEAFNGYFQAWAKTDFSSLVSGNPVPIKVLIGEHDLSLTEEVMRGTYLRWLPNAELEILTNAGHYPMDEVPIALATSIQQFLR